MKAMVLAAGLGTRLRPLTNDRPKALVEVGGRTLLELTLARLKSFGVSDVIINVHHFADAMAAYLKAHDNFGMRIEISREDVLLDTGGGLKHAAWFFEGSAEGEPFLLHNVDVLSTVDLAGMLRLHIENDALATLAVQDRSTSRYLLFDGSGLLCGRQAGSNVTPELVRDVADPQALAFAGIHVLSTRIFSRLSEEGMFSIIGAYLRLSADGERIQAFRSDDSYWRDLGKPEAVAQAEHDVQSGTYPTV